MSKLKTATAASAIILCVSAVVAGGVVHYAMTDNQPPVAVALTSPPAAAEDAANTPNSAFAALLKAVASGDANVLVASFEPLSPSQEATVRKAAQGMAAANALRSAATAKFGDQAATGLLQRINIAPPEQIVSAAAAAAPVYDGNNAQIDIPRVGAVKFIKIGDAWKVRAEMLQSNLSFFSQFASVAPVFTKVTSAVKAGQYHDAEEVRKAIQAGLAEIDTAGDPTDRPNVLAPGTTPKATIAAFVWSQLTGNEDASLAFFVTPTPDQQAGIRTSAQLYAVGEQIRTAIAARFGAKTARTSILTLGIDQGVTRQLLDSVPGLGDAGATDRIQVDFAKIGLKMGMVKSDGVWKIEPASMGFGSNPKWRARLQDYYVPRYQQFASDIKDGTHKNAAELQAEVNALHQELVEDRKQYYPGN